MTKRDCVRWLEDLGSEDVSLGGGKNASLGEMLRNLTQLVLGVDRDSDKLAYLFDERNEAVQRFIAQFIAQLIDDAHEAGAKSRNLRAGPERVPGVRALSRRAGYRLHLAQPRQRPRRQEGRGRKERLVSRSTRLRPRLGSHRARASDRGRRYRMKRSFDVGK